MPREDKLDVPIAGKAVKAGDRRLKQWRDPQSVPADAHVPGIHLLDVENVIDKPYQPIRVGQRDSQQFTALHRDLAGGAAEQQAERATQRGQRRAQLVTDS